ncbi:nickel-dependent hydrogenase large subunit [Desulfofustis glycolicus]|uniref:Hydrogenase large subunit n=1 Tax=Desulfofustis glycolicus DSM 9705 TaxID=1121409 RepID=A0A1M5V7Q9_9BACT|nr:nickel-dependent hydrogenase large subunit [Desulfofustis glycolicus]MCB2214924.1 nickel-dependent hydrogenase large subunit [Desulfobulbaceae bacterium]SHH71250.1 hydrogenase large subunit [Desulfofustis glycolicus DSM 9705]
MSIVTRGVNIPLNRAEGDLEVRVEIEDGVVAEAWSAGTMYRGFEAMMRGRGALDGLVVTPRVCGICSLTHLSAAVAALDAIAGVEPPDNAWRLRNLALMMETIQSDVRQSILMFMVDFANRQAYHDLPLLEDACERYSPLAGRAAIEVVRETKRLLQGVAIIGGQWPHTSFMVPGGVTSMPDVSKILQCRIIIERFIAWYERTILGCSLERWQQVGSVTDLENWLEENDAHQDSELGFFLRIARQSDLHLLGRGPNRFLSYGNLVLPEDTTVGGFDGKVSRAGWAEGAEVFPLDAGKITEDTSHSWFAPGKPPLHPFDGETKPYASGHSGQVYSWVKAPRYDGQVAETGPLAEMIIDGRPLFKDLIERQGPSVFARQLARFVRPAALLPPMRVWADELRQHCMDLFYRSVKMIPDGEGVGMVEAARGALGHWVKVRDEKISHYQIITPTAWNGSPRDSEGRRGAWEEALIGTPIADQANPVAAGHVVRSFDPCLVCAVHCLQSGRRTGRMKIDSNR